MSGLFITFEGIEGSGKTTQAARLNASLSQRGHKVLLTREPGGTDLAEQIRSLILGIREEPVFPQTELLLFLAARAQHVRRKILPALERGETVICDRFADATLAYQGGGRNAPRETLRVLDEWATGGLTPTRTYLLDVPVTVGIARVKNRQVFYGIDRIEREGVGFLEAVRTEYLHLAAAEPERVICLDGQNPADSLAKTILSDVESMLSGRHSRTSKGTPQ